MKSVFDLNFIQLLSYIIGGMDGHIFWICMLVFAPQKNCMLDFDPLKKCMLDFHFFKLKCWLPHLHRCYRYMGSHSQAAASRAVAYFHLEGVLLDLMVRTKVASQSSAKFSSWCFSLFQPINYVNIDLISIAIIGFGGSQSIIIAEDL